MKLRNCDFRNALEWLSGKLNLPIPHADRRRLVDPRQSGLQLAFDIFKSQSEAEVDRVSQFASQRAFEVELLSRVEVFAAEPPKLSWEAQKRGREAVENLLASGLIRRKVLSAATGASLPTDLPPRDFFLRPRIIFTLRDDRGKLVGFAGRALSPDDEPKYLYSPGFPRGETLYRLDHIRSAIRAHASNKPQRLDIFAVEGLLDALRLESLGLHAVAVFGTQLTLAQARLFSQLASDLDRDGCQLVLHLFFDADEPGRHALRTALPRLLEAGAFGDSTGFLIDVILPKLSEQKSDPDEMLRTCKSQGQALSVIGQNAYSVMEAFLADALSSEPVDVALRSAQLPD
jgi:DNA primase